MILVDDGLATGSTMLAAIHAVGAEDPQRVIVAMPVTDPDVCEALHAVADQVVRLMTPQPLGVAGASATAPPSVPEDQRI